MAVKFTNNAKTTLSSGINSSVTSAAVADGSVFPSLGAGEYFYITFDDGTNNEICKVTARSGNNLTIVRAQDSTTARAFSSGDEAQLRITASLLTEIQENIASKSANQTVYNATAASSATDYNIGVDPGVEANAMVFLDGVMQHHDTFSFSGSTLTFDAAPTNGTKIEVIVDNLINLQSSNLTVDTFTATSGQTAFTLSDAPGGESNVVAFIDGVFQNQAAFTLSSNTLTFDTGVTVGRTVTVYTINPVNIGTPSDSTVTSSKLSGNITMPGSLTVGSYDVAFDSPTFVVDNSNSRVGIGTASPSNGVLDVVGEVHISSHLDMPDSAKIKLGTGDDLTLYHDGSSSHIENQVSNLTFTNYADDSDIIFRTDDGSGGHTAYVTLDGSATKVILNKDTKLGDNTELQLGNDNDFVLKHNATNSVISTETGDLVLLNNADDKDIVFQSDDGSGGVQTYLTIDGSADRTVFSRSSRHDDNVVATFGTSEDLQIYHDGSYSYIKESGTGDLRIQASTNVQIYNSALDKQSANFHTAGPVTLYYDNSAKFATSSAGVTITGSIANTSGDFTLDVAGDIILDAGGQNWYFDDDGTRVLSISQVSSDVYIGSEVSDKDMFFRGNDGGSTITALTLDMSDAGTAIFNNTIKVSVDSDVVAEIGRAHVGGGITGLSDYAIFSHLHAADSGGYALAQNASGATFLNADDGQDITFLAHGTSIATLASDASLTLTGDLVIPSTITHSGDTDTKLDFNQANTMRLITGDTTAWIANASSMVINEDSADFDFRIESNDSANMLVVDGGDNTVTIAANNTASVTNSATALAARTLIINGNEGEGSDNLSVFAMADGTGNYGMEVSNSAHTAQYDLLINPIMGGNVGIGTTSATSQLHLENSASNSVVQVGYKNDAQEWRMGVHGGVSDSFLLYDNTNTTTRLKVLTSGAISSTTGGMVLQTKEVYASSATSISSGSTAVICSTTITILENSKLCVWGHSGQILNNATGQNANMLIQWVDSGGTVTNISDHSGNHYGWDQTHNIDRQFMTSQGISGALSAGTYTVRLLGGAYGGAVTMNYQNIGSHMIIQEISEG